MSRRGRPSAHGEQPGPGRPGSAERCLGGAAGQAGEAGSAPPYSCSPPLPSLGDCPRWLGDCPRSLGDSLGEPGRHRPPVKTLAVLLERLLLRAVIWLSR